ncbi:MAG: sugar transferase [Ignavibacteriaceae bacterium]
MNKTKYKYYLALSDFIVLDLAVVFSIYFVGYNPSIGFQEAGIFSDNIFFSFLIVGVVYLLIFENSQLYQPNIISIKSAHVNAVIKTVLYMSIGLAIVSFILAYTHILQASILIATFSVTAFLLLYLYRVQIITPFYLSKGKFGKNVLIVGNGTAGERIADVLSEDNSPFIIAGFVEKSASGKINGKYPGSLNEIDRITKENKINEIIIAYNGKNYAELFDTVDLCRKANTALKVSSPLFDVINRKIKCEKYGDISLVNLSRENTFYIKSGLKRIVDVIGAIVGIVLLLPLFIIIAILIKLSSPGPVLFKQLRVGKDGKLFKFYKFRSMYQVQGEDEERARIMKDFVKKDKVDADDTKIVNLSRVTRVGRIIRRTSIDELPQLFNVLKGDMSLVGPRPDVPYVYELYENWQKRRVNGIPGCTGVWQVTGRSEVTFSEMAVLDIYYLHNISFLLDLKMILKTLPVMFFSRGGK